MKTNYFKLIPYHSPTLAILRHVFTNGSTKILSWKNFRFYQDNFMDYHVIQGSILSFLGYQIPDTRKSFFKYKLELPNDPDDIIGNYQFNKRRIIEISKNKILYPPLVVGCNIFSWFYDKFINVAAALYRGDKSIDVFAPSNLKEVRNCVYRENSGNFT